MKINSLFTVPKPVIGVVHLLPLPGTPNYGGEPVPVIDRAVQEAQILYQGGVNGIIIENFNDDPFSKDEITKEQLCLMASIITLVRKEVNLPLGVNVHFNDWKAEIALAYACRTQFVRIEVYVDTVITTSGMVEPCCADVTRYRKFLNISESLQIWADIHPKYSKNISPYTLTESARMAQDALADTIIVTGLTTGIETPLDDIREVKNSVSLPVYAGSGTHAENVIDTLDIADGVIVGSAFKIDGDVRKTVSLVKVKEFMNAINSRHS